jgi:Uma2 family endonuclease
LKILDKRIWTYRDYIKLNDDKRYEVIEGRLVEMAGASFEHQDILSEIFIRMREFVKRNNLGKVIPSPFDVILSDENVVQPDIVFISKNKLHLIKQSLFGIPDLVVEIVSESSKKKDKIIKKKLYEKFGINEYWVVEPNDKKIIVHVINNNRYVVYSSAKEEGIIKSKVLEGFELNLKEVFE